MNEMAKEYATALNRPVKYVDMPYDKWLKKELLPLDLPQYVFDHISIMAKLHAENRYDRLTRDVETIFVETFRHSKNTTVFTGRLDLDRLFTYG
jgi:NAD(P)H dehydrogenase (quinone)